MRLVAFVHFIKEWDTRKELGVPKKGPVDMIYDHSPLSYYNRQMVLFYAHHYD